MKKILVLILFFAGLVLYSCASRKSDPLIGQAFIPANERIRNGEQVFMQNCQKCHPGGESGLGPGINWVPGFLKKFQTRHGMGVMPSFKKDEISKQDLRDMARFLNAWAGR